MTMRAATEAERLYAARQSMQIEGQTGGIGRLQMNLHDAQKTTGEWKDYQKDLNTEEFRKDSETVFAALKDSLSRFFQEHPESRAENGTYTVRADTAQYSYIAKTNPAEREGAALVYCYYRRHLDSHMQQAAKGIRFITSGYQEKFRVQDGATVRVIAGDGKAWDNTARYIDDCHLELVSQRSGWAELFHICQLAEILERGGRTVVPVQGGMPEKRHLRKSERISREEER